MLRPILFLFCVLTVILLAPVALYAAPPPDLVAQTSANLVLCGGGTVPDEAMSKFLELAGGSKAKIVILSAGQSAPAKTLLGDAAEKAASISIIHTRKAR